MRDREPAIRQFGEEGLNVAQAPAARRRVARVADGARAGQPLDHVAPGEGVANQPCVPFDVELRAVIGNDAGRLLAAMLERMETERHDGRGVLPAEYAEHAAFVVEMVIGFRRQVSRFRHDAEGLDWRTAPVIWERRRLRASFHAPRNPAIRTLTRP